MAILSLNYPSLFLISLWPLVVAASIIIIIIIIKVLEKQTSVIIILRLIIILFIPESYIFLFPCYLLISPINKDKSNHDNVT